MSSQSISLKTSDGHSLAAYEARPDEWLWLFAAKPQN